MVAIVIQAGGKSIRMGEDKALVQFRGESMIHRVLRRLDGIGEEVVITTNHPENFGFLKLRLAGDSLEEGGALGGLYTALLSTSQAVVAVAACDMPFVNAELFAAEIAILLSGELDVVIPHTAKGFEPFHAVYRRETCLAAVKNALNMGQRKMTSWFPIVRVREMGDDELRAYDPEMRCFINLNTPEDLAMAETLVEQFGEG
jgi:molybdopterin-guanine dinucleotide biosynthesis protein A